jgi:hypothetical protein
MAIIPIHPGEHLAEELKERANADAAEFARLSRLSRGSSNGWKFDREERGTNWRNADRRRRKSAVLS